MYSNILVHKIMANRQQFKVVLLGEGCVGKTSIILRYLEDKFNDKHYQTLQVGVTPFPHYCTLVY